MIKKTIRVIFVILFILGWGLSAFSLHVIRTPDEIPITLVTKDHFGLRDTYVDTRSWTMDDAAQHPELVSKLIAINKADVLKHVATDSRAGDVKVQLIAALQRGPKKEAATTATQPSAGASLLNGFFPGMF
jgi:hypothetical protein